MKRVLIAIDYNPLSERVAEKGTQLAEKLGAEICLAHVISDINYYGVQYPNFMGYEGYDMSVDLSVTSELKKVAIDFLTTAASHLKSEAIQTKLLEGNTAGALLRYAETWNADLLVMGTHSHSWLEKVFLGSTAASVIEQTEVPVFLIPVKDKADEKSENK